MDQFTVYLCYCYFDHISNLIFLSLSPSHLTQLLSLSLPCREYKVQLEAQVPKVILAGRCSKSSAVTGTVVVRAIVRAEGQVELGYAKQLTWRKIFG